MTPPECGCRIEFVADPPRGSMGYDGNGDFQIIHCRLCKSAPALLRAAKELLLYAKGGPSMGNYEFKTWALGDKYSMIDRADEAIKQAEGGKDVVGNR